MWGLIPCSVPAGTACAMHTVALVSDGGLEIAQLLSFDHGVKHKHPRSVNLLSITAATASTATASGGRPSRQSDCEKVTHRERAHVGTYALLLNSLPQPEHVPSRLAKRC